MQTAAFDVKTNCLILIYTDVICPIVIQLMPHPVYNVPGLMGSD